MCSVSQHVLICVHVCDLCSNSVYLWISADTSNSAKWRDAKGKLRSVLRCARILCSVQMGLCLLYLLWQINLTFVGYMCCLKLTPLSPKSKPEN